MVNYVGRVTALSHLMRSEYVHLMWIFFNQEEEMSLDLRMPISGKVRASAQLSIVIFLGG